MKKSTCLGMRCACDYELQGETADEMGEACKVHVMEMIQAGDDDHQAAIACMMALSPEEQQEWIEGFINAFDSLPDA